jgi:hypothetical protein
MMKVPRSAPNGYETSVAAPAQVHAVDSSRRLASLFGRIAGLVVLASAVDLALGGALANIRFHLLGNEFSLSCLACPMALMGTLLLLVTCRPSTGTAE